MSQAVTRVVERADGFAQLQKVVLDLCQGDVVPSAASVKSQLLSRHPDFNERLWGFKKFIDFVEAAAKDNLIAVTRDPSGHPRLYPLGFSVEKVAASIKQPARVSSGARKLKHSVWRAFVAWEPRDYWRYWDKSQNHPVLSPVMSPTAPPWELDPPRFVKLEPISREVQVEWMREFAESQSQPHRATILAALSPDSAIGAFRQALQADKLAESWRLALEVRVNHHAEEWARAVGVGASKLFEAPVRMKSPSPAEAPAGSDPESPEDLRHAIHLVVDRMTTDDLRGLQIPARYLIEL